MLHLCPKELIEESFVLVLNNGINCGRGFLNAMLQDINVNIKSLEILSEHLASFIISKVHDNNELYKLHQSYLNGTEEDRCLICTKSVNLHRYARFTDCNHKLCFTCSLSYFPNQGKCPFDGRESADFVICERDKYGMENLESASRYNYEEFRMNKTRTMMMYNIELLDEILEFNIYIPPLTDILEQILAETIKSKQDELFRSLVEKFGEIEKNKIVKFDHITWSRMENELDLMIFEIGKSRKRYNRDKQLITLNQLNSYCLFILNNLARSIVLVFRYSLFLNVDYIRSSLENLLSSLKKLELERTVVIGKLWTTDGIFRDTIDRLKQLTLRI